MSCEWVALISEGLMRDFAFFFQLDSLMVQNPLKTVYQCEKCSLQRKLIKIKSGRISARGCMC